MTNIPGITNFAYPNYPTWEMILEEYMKNEQFSKMRTLLEVMGFTCGCPERHHPDLIPDGYRKKPAEFRRPDFDYYLLAYGNRGMWFGSNKVEVFYSNLDQNKRYYKTETLTWQEMLAVFPEKDLDIIIFNLDFLNIIQDDRTFIVG